MKQAKLGIFSLDEFPHPVHCVVATHYGAAMEQGSDLPPSAVVAGSGSQAQPGAAHLSRHTTSPDCRVHRKCCWQKEVPLDFAGTGSAHGTPWLSTLTEGAVGVGA